MKNAGRIMPIPKGEYSDTTVYSMLDFVKYDGSSYICKKESTGNTPDRNSEYWQLMAEKGSSGGAVTGVKGNAETVYRQGNINLTKENIGLGNLANERQYSESNPQPSVTGSSGSCTGNAATATRATQDKNGNDIVDTYATKLEMNALKKSVSDGKTLVANAITAKGVATAADAEFATMAGNIAAIQTGTDTSDATAVAANILTGKTAYVKGSKVTGTMAEKAGVTVDSTATTQDSDYTYLSMPDGHYSTASKVRTKNSNIFALKTYRDANVSSGSNLTVVLPQKPSVFIAFNSDWGLSGGYGASLYDVKNKKVLTKNNYGNAGEITSFDDATRKLTFSFGHGAGVTVWYC